MIDRFKENFREEAVELLENLEDDLMRLEESPDDREMIDAVFRAIHTVKGSAAMFGFNSASRFAHEVEMTLDRLRDGEFGVSKPFIDALLECRDHILDMIQKDLDESAEADEVSHDLAVRLAGTTGGGSAPPVRREDEMQTIRIRFAPGAGIFLSGSKPLLMIRELAEMGDMTVLAKPSAALDSLEGMDPESCLTSWDIFLTTKAGMNAVKDVFIFVEDESKIEYQVLEEGDPASEPDLKLGEILVNAGNLKPEDVSAALKGQKPLGEMLVESAKLSGEDLDSALEAQKHIKTVRDKRSPAGQGSVRVDAGKLDDLVDLVGELVTIQARMSQTVRPEHGDGLRTVSEELERLVVALRETAMSIRMLPIGTTFNRYKRLVRDLSGELKKNVELITRGGETELDKTVLDKLNDPLVHLIRNSLDHGIEDPAVREKRNKPAAGRIRLSAEHVGASVEIVVEDDGGGLDRDAILEKARARGLVREGYEPSLQEIYQYIFHPGFSTAANVTSVSGRGVGMDVVMRQISELGGTVRIESAKQAYTRIILELPLTLAIIEGMLVSSGGESFIFPLASVEACIELTEAQRRQEAGRILSFRERLLPYVRLREVFSIPGELPPIEQVVVINVGGQHVGFAIDQVVGSHQTVIKNLGQVYRHAEGVSGATILGDGSVALILDPPKVAMNFREGAAIE